jgi:hypothetical protein
MSDTKSKGAESSAAAVEWKTLAQSMNGKVGAGLHGLMRAKIHGGWLVYTGNEMPGAILYFVPDPKHQWNAKET